MRECIFSLSDATEIFWRPAGAGARAIGASGAVFRLPNLLLEVTPGRLVAVGRLVLAGFSLLAIYIEPSQPAHNASTTYGILIGYVVYATVLCGVAFLSNVGGSAAIVAHAIDVSVFAGLIHFTDGPTSPFFVFLTFAIFSAALQWSWLGASVTTVIASVIYIILSLAAVGPIHDLNRVVIRCVDLLMAGAFLSYLSAILKNANVRLRKLADWPRPMQDIPSEYPEIGRAIEHAAGVLGTDRALVIWQSTDEPVANKVKYDRGSVRFETVQAGVLPGAPVEQLTTESRKRPRNRTTGATGSVVRISGSGFIGSLRFMNFRPSADGRMLAEIVAHQIGNEIERHLLQQQLITAVAVRERERMAADIHDDLLQSLAAMALQLKALQSVVPEKAHTKITNIGKVIDAQQTRLRELIARVRDTQSEPSLPRPLMFAVRKEIGTLLESLQTQWACAVMLHVDPPAAEIPWSMGADVVFVVTEAVANAVRHGRAMYVEINVVVRERMLSMTISDDGVSYVKELADGVDGTEVEERSGSSSIRRRITNLGGSVQSSRATGGFRVEIQVPVRSRRLV